MMRMKKSYLGMMLVVIGVGMGMNSLKKAEKVSSSSARHESPKHFSSTPSEPVHSETKNTSERNSEPQDWRVMSTDQIKQRYMEYCDQSESFKDEMADLDIKIEDLKELLQKGDTRSQTVEAFNSEVLARVNLTLITTFCKVRKTERGEVHGAL